MSDFATVVRFMNLAEATAAHSMLEGAGLDPRTRDEYTAGLNWHSIPALGGVRVEVPTSQLGEAQELLATYAEGADLLSAEEESYLRSSARKRRLFGLLVVLVSAPWIALAGLVLSRVVKVRDGDKR
jgi:hypothetical protein